jgi:hypothetical protein
MSGSDISGSLIFGVSLYIVVSKKGFAIPQITINTGITAPDGREEKLTEYICDHPGCPNVATHVLGYVKEIGLAAAVCDDHAPKIKDRTRLG